MGYSGGYIALDAPQTSDALTDSGKIRRPLPRTAPSGPTTWSSRLSRTRARRRRVGSRWRAASRSTAMTAAVASSTSSADERPASSRGLEVLQRSPLRDGAEPYTSLPAASPTYCRDRTKKRLQHPMCRRRLGPASLLSSAVAWFASQTRRSLRRSSPMGPRYVAPTTRAARHAREGECRLARALLRP